MKKLVISLLAISFLSMAVVAQDLKNLDFIAPFSEGMAAVKKGNQWSFITAEGKLAFDFRDDLVTTNFGESSYPVFKDGKCLIVQVNKGISYFGYIDKKGETVIEPKFLNATNFENGKAIVLKLDTEAKGRGNVLGQNIVEHSYVNVMINGKGEYVKYLSDWKKITLSSKIVKKPPMICAKLISDNLYALYENKKWTVKPLNE